MRPIAAEKNVTNRWDSYRKELEGCDFIAEEVSSVSFVCPLETGRRQFAQRQGAETFPAGDRGGMADGL